MDVLNVHTAFVSCPGMDKGLADGLVGILQVIFSDEGNVDRVLRIVKFMKEIVPFFEVRLRYVGQREMIENELVKPLFLHLERYLIYRVSVNRLDDMTRLHVAKQGNLLAEFRREVVLGAAHDDVRLHATLLKHLHRVLGRLGLKFLGSLEIRYKGKVYRHAVLLGKLPLELTHGLDERMGLHIAHCSTDFGDDDVVVAGL